MDMTDSKTQLKQLDLPEQPIESGQLRESLRNAELDVPASLKQAIQKAASEGALTVRDEGQVMGVEAKKSDKPTSETSGTTTALNIAAIVLILLSSLNAVKTVQAESAIRDHSPAVNKTENAHYQQLQDHWKDLYQNYDLTDDDTVEVYHEQNGQSVHAMQVSNVINQLWSSSPTRLVFRGDLTVEEEAEIKNDDRTALIELPESNYVEAQLQPAPDTVESSGESTADAGETSTDEVTDVEQMDAEQTANVMTDLGPNEYASWDAFQSQSIYGTARDVSVIVPPAERQRRTSIHAVPDLFDGERITYVKEGVEREDSDEYNGFVRMPNGTVAGLKTSEIRQPESREHQDQTTSFKKRNELRRILQGSRQTQYERNFDSRITSNLLKNGSVRYSAVGAGIRDQLRHEIKDIEPDDPMSAKDLVEITQFTSYRIESIDNVQDLSKQSSAIGDWLHTAGNIGLIAGLLGEAYEELADEDVDTQEVIEVAATAKGVGWLQEAMTSDKKPLPKLKENQAAFAVKGPDPSTDPTAAGAGEYKLIILSFDETEYHSD